jgi:hypothetical protein
MTLSSALQDSFTHVNDWLNEVNRYASEGTCKLLVGNKSDRTDKVVQYETAKVCSTSSLQPFAHTPVLTCAVPCTTDIRGQPWDSIPRNFRKERK